MSKPLIDWTFRQFLDSFEEPDALKVVADDKATWTIVVGRGPSAGRLRTFLALLEQLALEHEADYILNRAALPVVDVDHVIAQILAGACTFAAGPEGAAGLRRALRWVVELPVTPSAVDQLTMQIHALAGLDLAEGYERIRALSEACFQAVEATIE